MIIDYCDGAACRNALPEIKYKYTHVPQSQNPSCPLTHLQGSFLSALWKLIKDVIINPHHRMHYNCILCVFVLECIESKFYVSTWSRCPGKAWTDLSGRGQRVQFVPGYRPMLSPVSLLGATLPETWWNLGLDWAWRYKETGMSRGNKLDLSTNIFSAFFNYQHDIISIVPWLVGEPAYVTCSLNVAKQVLVNESQRKTELLKPYWTSLPFL